MAQITVKPDKTRLLNLLEDIASGNYKIPVFQRDFVWNPNQMIELLDSIIKGYPIGSLLFWKPGVIFNTKQNIGPYEMPSQKGDASYVLDGFQRITTLFGVLTNPKTFNVPEDSPELRDYLIYYDLRQKEFTYIKNKKNKDFSLIPVFRIVDTFEFLDFLREIELKIEDKEDKSILITNAKQVSKILYDYEIPFVEIKGGDIKSAVQIFSRINSTGTEISEDFMLSALSYKEQTNFLFSESITQFLNSLADYNFNSLKRNTILSCISSSKGKIYFDVRIEELLHPDLEELTSKAFGHIKKAVEFLYKQMRVIDIKLLPYPSQLIFISEFFRINPNPSDAKQNDLVKWFWITSYSNYFTIYSLSQQRNAYNTFCKFASGEHQTGIFKPNPTDKFYVLDFPEKLSFTGVRAKTLQLFMLRNILLGEEIYLNESIREFFLFTKRDRAPANMVLRVGSEFDSNPLKRDLDTFVNNTDIKTLEKYFINDELLTLFKDKNIDEFVIRREKFMKSEEEAFINKLGLYEI